MQFRKIKLYHYPATRSARVKWVLHETIGDNFEVEIVPLYEGKQYTAEYLEMNPNHNVPMLEITLENGETTTMLESGAMVTLFADSFIDANLAPKAENGGIARADYLQMLYFASSWMDMMLWQIRIHQDILPKAERDEKTCERYREKFVSEVEPQLIARLSKHDYICSNEFSAADIIITHNIMWAKMYGLCQHDVFSRYLSKVTKRPAFIKAFSDAKQFNLKPDKDSPVKANFSG
ncbi:glutathione S-transferase [Thalassotalea sp. 42_200_T64]|nr:glutathione S-transferase [Thalassotalea sp. 42_200_T64]